MAPRKSIRRSAWLTGLVGLALIILSACGASGLQIPNTGGLFANTPPTPTWLGTAFVASAVDQNGCPADHAQAFTANQPVYLGFTTSAVPEGANLFVRLNREGQPLLDTRQITARPTQNACVWFVFRPGDISAGFKPGRYQAEFFVSKQQVGSLAFTVQNSGAGSLPVSGGGFFGSGPKTTDGVHLSNLITSDRVDHQGCPGDTIVEFRGDQAVYAGYDSSLFPAGTKMYALFLRGDQLLQTTSAITTDRVVQRCFYFKFEPGDGGLPSGEYNVQIFINGKQADSVQFSVR